MMDAVLASDGEEAVGVGEKGEEGDENDGKDERYSRADLSEWRIEDKADYGRLASQVGTYWHDRGKVDAYYFDGFVFICVKGKNFGDFTIADVFSVDIPYEEFEARRKRAIRQLVDTQASGVVRSVGVFRNEFGRGVGGASRFENGRANADNGRGNDSLLGEDGENAESQSSDDGDGVYTPDGRLFARRVRRGRRNSVVRDGGEVNTENTEERRNRESPAFKSATGNAGTYAPEDPDIRYSVLRKRGKWDNWRVVDMQELAELNINYGALRDSKRKIDFYFSVDSERAYLIRKSDSFSASFDILAVFEINSPKDEFDRRRKRAYQLLDDATSRGRLPSVDLLRALFRDDISDATLSENGKAASSDGAFDSELPREVGGFSGARSSDGDACFDGNGKLVAYRIGGKYVDERVRVRFRRATAGGRPPFRSRGVPFLCGRKRVSGRAWRRCGAARAPFLPGRRRR
ncbi:MAG: hypothetical protein ACI4P6_05470 [Candidatus Spyradosoma sp.]